MPTLRITDDGDEEVYISLDDKLLFITNHEEHGWSGMTDIIQLATILADVGGIPVENSQDIV